MAKGYEIARVAVDPVVFTLSGKDLLVLLNQREKAPYAGRHELPGGFLLAGENPESALRRKLKQLFNRNIYFTQFKTFYAPDRDPRMRTISIGFVALVPESAVKSTDRWSKVSSLPRLAFDHNEIVKEAALFLKQNISTLIARHLLPEKFPLNQLQKAYEAIEGTRYDNRNFRKKMLYDKIVEPTDEFLSKSSNRPPRLYRFRGTSG
jgi:8-oxo-dGTP diphosphatase